MALNVTHLLNNPVNLSELETNETIVLPLYNTNLFLRSYPPLDLGLMGAGENIFFELMPENLLYITPIGIGTPPQRGVWVIDTGSGVTWSVCDPCDHNCPASSSTFHKSLSSSFQMVDCHNTNECFGENFGCASVYSRACEFRTGYAGAEESPIASRLILNARTDQRGSGTRILPILTQDRSMQYYIQFNGIIVDDDYLQVDAAANPSETRYAFIDTGAPTSHLPAEFYVRYRHSFKKHMTSFLHEILFLLLLLRELQYCVLN
ncbi:OLC1v1007612C1 [Oldenlandia corymbosa var. corymbosa]|uniref:OLC1v1007612C1 n=1 Tax=Oldenlandia corymbosa var. corymbosa TaxID=529605 RepID=A0AAV1DK73_OLDCO|nr:OLC1v1007612C1 [Oldenlandia corymbosa var. corymbosa]